MKNHHDKDKEMTKDQGQDQGPKLKGIIARVDIAVHQFTTAAIAQGFTPTQLNAGIQVINRTLG